MGLLYFFTAGIFGIGWFIDLFTLGSQVDQYNLMFARPFGNNNLNTNNIVVNVPGHTPHIPSASISDQLHKLHELKEKGILSEEEYAIQKGKVLGSN